MVAVVEDKRHLNATSRTPHRERQGLGNAAKRNLDSGPTAYSICNRDPIKCHNQPLDECCGAKLGGLLNIPSRIQGADRNTYGDKKTPIAERQAYVGPPIMLRSYRPASYVARLTETGVLCATVKLHIALCLSSSGVCDELAGPIPRIPIREVR